MNNNKLFVQRLGIDTQEAYVIYMREDCHICKSEGFEVLTRLKVSYQDRTLIATLNLVRSNLLEPGEASLSEGAWKKLGLNDDSQITVSHLPPVESFHHVRSKMYGNRLSPRQMEEIIKDICSGNYSNIQLSAFVAACSGDRLDLNEIISLTQAMVNSGEQIKWGLPLLVDKHCIGGLPGNRTTPIVVSICAAAGLSIPKTSSRAITSPAGTADTMEVITNVNLSSEQIKQVVTREGGCFAWGGSVKLSPADDILIRVEKALDVDSEGQMIASVLSKKAAAGSTHVIIDIPIGPSAKVRSNPEAEKLKKYFIEVGKKIGIQVVVLFTDGTQPVGRGIGPALEARDLLAVLRSSANAPADLRDRALTIAGKLLEMTSSAKSGEGKALATSILDSGEALEKFEAICKAQGALREPSLASFKHDVRAPRTGKITALDNRRIARVAKLAGAPQNPSAGVDFFAHLGRKVNLGDCLFTLYSESEGELEYALNYFRDQKDIITIS